MNNVKRETYKSTSLDVCSSGLMCANSFPARKMDKAFSKGLGKTGGSLPPSRSKDSSHQFILGDTTWRPQAP